MGRPVSTVSDHPQSMRVGVAWAGHLTSDASDKRMNRPTIGTADEAMQKSIR